MEIGQGYMGRDGLKDSIRGGGTIGGVPRKKKGRRRAGLRISDVQGAFASPQQAPPPQNCSGLGHLQDGPQAPPQGKGAETIKFINNYVLAVSGHVPSNRAVPRSFFFWACAICGWEPNVSGGLEVWGD